MPPSFIATMSTSKVVPFRKDFQWACRPILSWMQFIGIPLDVLIEQKSMTKRILTGLYALLVYFLLTSNTWITATSYVNVHLSTNGTSVTSSINNHITYFNYAISTFLIHTSLLVMTALDWNGLAMVLHQMGQENWFTSEDYRRFRLVCFAGLAILILV